MRLGLPLGLGKPNRFVNALYRRVAADPSLRLTIFTALSLAPPRPRSDLEARFLGPFVERVFGDHEALAYVAARAAGALPSNVRVHEFFYVPGSLLHSDPAQRDYISLDYSDVVRDVGRLGLNAFAQLVATRGAGDARRLSLACNPDITLDLVAAMRDRRAAGEVIVFVAETHPDLPFMGHDAEVEPGFFDLVVDDPAPPSALFGAPQMPIELQDHLIGLYTSALLRDGGTLQIGIGTLGDAVAHHTRLRHRDNAAWRALLDAVGVDDDFGALIDAVGGRAPFARGLYGCSEMFTLGLLELIDAGVIRRAVYPDAERQDRADAGDDPGGGVVMHGGFFLGPARFYARLRALDPAARARIAMTRIAFTNTLYGAEALKRRHRRDARFVNAAHTATLLGAAASDLIDDGRVLSGVGGQHDFVMQAHALDGARSILLVRSWRERGGHARSNIVFAHPHVAIPRHLRDLYVTEYGVADLRGQSDGACVAAMIAVADSRFQDALIADARAAGRLAADFRLAERHRHNTPERLAVLAAEHRALLPRFPLGTEFDETEQALLAALGWLRDTANHRRYLTLARQAWGADDDAARFAPHLARMGLAAPSGVREQLYRRLVLAALTATEGR